MSFADNAEMSTLRRRLTSTCHRDIISSWRNPCLYELRSFLPSWWKHLDKTCIHVYWSRVSIGPHTRGDTMTLSLRVLTLTMGKFGQEGPSHLYNRDSSYFSGSWCLSWSLRHILIYDTRKLIPQRAFPQDLPSPVASSWLNRK